MMSLSNAVNGFSGEVAWNCADRSLFGACQLETGDQVQVVSSYFGNVIIKAKGKMTCYNKRCGGADKAGLD